MYLSINMTILYSKLESRQPVASHIYSGILFSYSSLFLEGMQHWWWVQVTSGITLVKIYCMPPPTPLFFPLVILRSSWIDSCIYPRRSCTQLSLEQPTNTMVELALARSSESNGRHPPTAQARLELRSPLQQYSAAK